jgi:cellulose synthase/poly-beta-1,6-N-acetylglucosamine synthase-like glycosyltransferase
MTLPPPNPALRACVVVPARNEEDLITSCLEALARQEHVALHEYEVLLTLDRCTDETEARARKIGGVHPSLKLHFPIHRLLSVRVTTSPRLAGRATLGLSNDLARTASSLREERPWGPGR